VAFFLSYLPLTTGLRVPGRMSSRITFISERTSQVMESIMFLCCIGNLSHREAGETWKVASE